jgi:hypothetical protein
MKPCQKPIELEKLVAWWLNELSDEAIDEHLLACAHCTIRAEDDAVVSRLKASLVGARRVDALHSIEVGGRVERLKAEDVPFDAQAGEVLLMPAPTQLRNMPAHTWRVQLVAVEEGRERVLGDYTFQHAPA